MLDCIAVFPGDSDSGWEAQGYNSAARQRDIDAGGDWAIGLVDRHHFWVDGVEQSYQLRVSSQGTGSVTAEGDFGLAAGWISP